MKKIKNKLLRFFKYFFIKLCRIHDTPQKIAQGFGLGIFLGVMPGIGIFAAIVMASLLRLNRASAIFGTLLTNTWTSFIILILSIKTGSAIMGLPWQEVYNNFKGLIKDFHFANLLKLSFLKLLLPIILGYLIIAVILGLLA